MIANKDLLKQCSKILTAFIEESNLFPYSQEELDTESNQFDFEVIYLQHGVMHLVMPWKYSREKMAADRIVVSTEEEATLLKNYGYSDVQLIKTGMPRWSLLNREERDKRILYAPSWRNYLVGAYENHQWEPLRDKFLASRFFVESNEFLNSESLRKLLEDNDYYLDVKLHPIFQMYKDAYNFASDRIRFSDGSISDGRYALMITDYSSYAYNFHFLNIPVLNFIPDEIEFKSGMNGYRLLNCPDSFWDFAAETCSDILKQVKNWLEGKEPRGNIYHFYSCEDICQSIYDAIRGGQNEWL